MKEQSKKKNKSRTQTKKPTLLHEMFKGPEVLKLNAWCLSQCSIVVRATPERNTFSWGSL